MIGTGSGANAIEFRPVAMSKSAILVATAERGGGVGKDIALRPTRIVTVGDASFVQNGALLARASANRDFFSNCVAYLSGVETHGSGESGHEGGFRTGMDRQGRLRHALCSAAAFPLAVFLVMAAIVFRRRRRA